MTLPNAAYQAAADWSNADENSADVDTGIEALGRLISALAGQDAAFRTLIGTAAMLVVAYCEHGTDPDGQATVELNNLLHGANLL